jgi:hypothetical protein
VKNLVNAKTNVVRLRIAEWGTGKGSLGVAMDEFCIHKSRLIRHSGKLGYLLL